MLPIHPKLQQTRIIQCMRKCTYFLTATVPTSLVAPLVQSKPNATAAIATCLSFLQQLRKTEADCLNTQTRLQSTPSSTIQPHLREFYSPDRLQKKKNSKSPKVTGERTGRLKNSWQEEKYAEVIHAAHQQGIETEKPAAAEGLHYYLSLITAQANCPGRKWGFWLPALGNIWTRTLLLTSRELRDPCLSDHQQPIFDVVLAEDINMNDIWRKALLELLPFMQHYCYVHRIIFCAQLHVSYHIRESSYYFTKLIHLSKSKLYFLNIFFFSPLSFLSNILLYLEIFPLIDCHWLTSPMNTGHWTSGR